MKPVLSVFCIYGEHSLVERIVDVFASHGAQVHLWALQKPVATVRSWTRGFGPGWKFDLLNRLISEHPDGTLTLVTDDDISFPEDFVEGYMDALRACAFDLAQPALTLDSYHSYPATLQRPWLTGRRQNRVEQMVFSMSDRFLQSIFPFADVGAFGWAQEFLWARVAREFGWRVGIIDTHPVSHCLRPLGSGYNRGQAHDEMDRALTIGGIDFEPILSLESYPATEGQSALTSQFQTVTRSLAAREILSIVSDVKTDTAKPLANTPLREGALPHQLNRYFRCVAGALEHPTVAEKEQASKLRQRLNAIPPNELSRFVLESIDVLLGRLVPLLRGKTRVAW